MLPEYYGLFALTVVIQVVVSSSGWTPWDYYTANPLNASWSMPKYMPRIESVYHNKKASAALLPPGVDPHRGAPFHWICMARV